MTGERPGILDRGRAHDVFPLEPGVEGCIMNQPSGHTIGTKLSPASFPKLPALENPRKILGTPSQLSEKAGSSGVVRLPLDSPARL